MLAEIAQRIAPNEIGGRSGKQHLPAVRAGGDPCRTVDVCPHVALLGRQRSTRMETHAHGERQLPLGLARGFEGTGRGRKGEEEPIALRIDLDAAVPRESLTENPPMFAKHTRIPLRAKFPQQPRRALNVRKDERQRPRRKLRLHLTDSASYSVAQPARRTIRPRSGVIPEHWPRPPTCTYGQNWNNQMAAWRRS